jgi:cytidylate kinase
MVPVITVDGPSGSGKGTISQLLAVRLGWNFLDSGALYRALGLAAQARGIALDAETALAALAGQLELRFEGERVLLDGRDVSDELRTETSGNAASKVAALPAVRAALLDWQRDQARAPGLVADGRDMGSVVFPHAPLKLFLTASAEERAQRRYKQLKGKGFDVSLSSLVEEIEERDRRDRSRSVAPLRPAADAVELDSSGLSIQEVFDRVLDQVRCALPQHLD